MKASEEEIARSLEGNWQEDLLFVLKQEQDGYEFCQKQMAECDRQLATVSPAARGSEPRRLSAGREAKGTAQEEERE